MDDSFGEPFARRYDDHAFLWRLYLPVISDIIHKIPHPRALDLGCGTGSLLIALAPSVEFSLGIDISPSMVAIARQKLRELSIRNVNFRVGDMLRMHLRRKFPIVLCTDGVTAYLRDETQLSIFFSRLSVLLEERACALIEFWTPSANPAPQSYSTQLPPHTTQCFPDELLNSTFLCESDTDELSGLIRHRFYLPGKPYSFSLLSSDGREALHRHRYYVPNEVRRMINTSGFKIKAEYGISTHSGLPQLGPFSRESPIWTALVTR